MINIDIFKRDVPCSELGQIKNPQMVQNSEELKQQASQNQSQGVVQDQGHQAQQLLRNMVQQERERVHNENQQTS